MALVEWESAGPKKGDVVVECRYGEKEAPVVVVVVVEEEAE